MLFRLVYSSGLGVIFGIFPAVSAFSASCAMSDVLKQMMVPSTQSRGVETAHSVQELLDAHRAGLKAGTIVRPKSMELTFNGGPKNRDFYNSPGEFKAKYKGEEKTIFAGREESSKSETDMKVGFYEKTGEGKYQYLNDDKLVPHLTLQDPAVVHIKTEHGNELVLAGVKVWPIHVNGKEELQYATVFYRDHGKGIEHLSEFLTGPSKMKDVRLAQSPDGKTITVFTRPQHSEERLGGRGKIGYFQVSNLEDITADKMKNAPIFRHQFADQEWGGVNAAEYLDDHRIGVIGHYARFDANNNRDYIGVSWILDTRANVLSTPKVILERSDLPRGLMRGSKRKDLRNVLFPGGFVKNPDGTYSIFGGEGDKRTFLAVVPNPFKD